MSQGCESSTLRSLETPADFAKVMDMLKNDMPQCANTFICMKYWQEGRTRTIAHRFFAYPWPRPVCFIAIRFNNHVNLPSIFFYGKQSETHKRSLILFFKQLELTLPEVFWKNDLFFESNQDKDTDAVQDYIRQRGRFETVPKDAEPSPSFFIPHKKWNDLMKLNIQPPEGYYFDTLKESDIPAVSETWRFRQGDDYIHMKFKIDHLPTACLRTQSDHKLAAFEVIDSSGYMTHLYTFPEHRRKGLATAVELKLAQQLVEDNVTPFKSAVYDNEAGLALSRSSTWFQPMNARRWHKFYPHDASHWASKTIIKQNT